MISLPEILGVVVLCLVLLVFIHISKRWGVVR